MFDESFPAFGNLINKVFDKFVAVELVNSQPTFDCAFDGNCLSHSLHALLYYFRFLHQASPERPLLYFGTGTANIEIDLIVPILLSEYCSLRQLLRIGASQLENDGVLILVEGEEMVMTVDDCIVMEHFGVESRLFGDQTHEVAEVGVGDVDHRGDCEQPGNGGDGFVVLHCFLL